MPAAPPGADDASPPPDAGGASSHLAHSNLLRLESSALLSEAALHVHPTGDDGRAHAEARWGPRARGYVSHVREVLHGLGRATLGPEVAALPNTGGDDGAVRYRVPLSSDKFAKSLDPTTKGTDANPLTSWSFPFHGGSSLAVVPIGSFAHVGNAGLANKRANGNVLPVLDVAVLFDGGEGEEAFVGGKDYLNHRYTDKRNLLAVHLARQLSQKKHRSKIGAVHLTHVFGDARKVGLLLTPPLDDDGDGGGAKKLEKKKKRKRSGDREEGDKKGKKNKLRFRIRLIFGVKTDDERRHHRRDDGSGSESSDEEMEEAAGASWIPRARLLPNRSNNRTSKHHHSDGHDDAGLAHGTPHYTNALAEDVHLLATTRLVNATISTLAATGSNVSPTTSFHETLLLLKVWALQRGFLRGHDAFTTTTLAMVLAYLYRTKTIGKRMGCVHAFTAFMKFWGETDWLGEDGLEAAVASGGDDAAARAREIKAQRKAGFVIPAEGRSEGQTVARCAQHRRYLDEVRGASDDRPKTLLECYKRCYASSATSSSSIPADAYHDAPVLLDPSMTLNYLARLSPSFVRESRAEAQGALRCIHGHATTGGGNEASAFRTLFLETNRFWTRYDAYLRVPLGDVMPVIGRKRPSEVWGRDADDLGCDEAVCRGVVGVLTRALGDRATAVRAFTSGNGDVRAGEADNARNEEVATRVVENSDECHAVPIRGSGSSLGYAASVAERRPGPPAYAKDTQPCLVVGLRLDPTASRRIVDRGPLAENNVASNAFVSLWGETKAQLRRFQDGAIVRAVVWNERDGSDAVPLCGADRSMGGIAERIARHVIGLHFTSRKKKEQGKSAVAFELRDMVSFIDGVAAAPSPSPFSDSLALHKNAMAAFNSLADFLRENTALSADGSSLGKGKRTSKLGLPLSIDEVEPLSPCLRYSALFPPTPHPLLGGNEGNDRKISGANVGSPILVQIRFEGSSKWPASLNAMGAAKCAMLVQLADGIDKMKQESSGKAEGFDGAIDVTPNYLDLGYRGYSWRIIVRADQELRMLRGLRNPTVEAKAMQLSLIDRHVRGSMHHSLIHAVHTQHPSASSVVRLAHRWVASHMLSDMIPLSAIELMVAKIYTETSHLENKAKKSKIASIDKPPSTVVAGFLRFLLLLSTHDWAREPLIVDPQNHISSHDRRLIHEQFDAVRGPELNRGPAMYIISPADYDRVEEMVGSKVVGDDNANTSQVAENAAEKVWAPTVTAHFPERVVLSRAVALARCSHDHLTGCIRSGTSGHGWVAAFQESSSSLTSYSALLRVDPSYITDSGCSSTNADCAIAVQSKMGGIEQQPSAPFEKNLQKRFAGPKELRKKHYKNLVLEKDTLHEWQPVQSLVKALRSKYNDYAVFFYNQFAPEVIAMIWRPDAFKPQPFSAIVSEFKRPVAEFWKEDSLVITNTDDLMQEIGFLSRDVVSTFKVFDDKKPNDAPLMTKRSKTAPADDDESSSGSEQE